MIKTVDSFRFASGLTKRVIKSWIKIESPRQIPWTPLQKPLSDCTVALISSGGIALKTDRPFDQEKERQNPWWGDPSYRIIPHATSTDQIRVYHQHIDASFAERDLNCLLPLDRLTELAEDNVIGRTAPSHYSFMGYILDPKKLIEQSVPGIIRSLREEAVDIVVLVPA
jgi:D-proline reductase (dithiol) PrdB